MNPSVQIVTLQEADAETLQMFFAKQNTRQVGLDTKLRHFRNKEVADCLEKMQSNQRDFLKVIDEDGAVCAGALPNVIEFPDDASILAIYPQRFGVVGMMSLPAPSAPHAAAIATTLVKTVASYWQSRGAMGGVFWWPTADSWIEPIFHQQDFLTYTAMAVRSGDDLPAHGHATPNSLTIRRAQPEDEEILLQLMVEEMVFHQDITPFARVVPGIEIDGRKRLSDAWSGKAPEAGASLFFVAEREGQIVGMMECSLSDLRNTWHNLTPEFYGDINAAIVAEAYRGQGIGHYLLDAALRELKGYGVRRFSLYYVQANPLSNRFWQSKGFRPVLSSYHKRYVDGGSPSLQGSVTKTVG